MATWNNVFNEVNNCKEPNPLDFIRRQKIAAIQQITGRPLVIYASDFTTQNPAKLQFINGITTIDVADKDGFFEVIQNLSSPDGTLDVVLHSPGGSAIATESIVELLRSQFSDIRFIVPSIAKSAATMLAMSGNAIMMDERSELGPIDPQFIFQRDKQIVVAPAQAILDQFEQAQNEINANPSKLPSWVPILREYSPALLLQSRNELMLAESLVTAWLEKYMFQGEGDANTKATNIAKYLNGHNNFHSHGRRIGIDDLKAQGVKVIDLRSDLPLREAVHDLYNAIMVTFARSMAAKIFENSQNDAHILLLNFEITPADPPSQMGQPNIKPPSPRPPIKGKKR